MGIPAEKHKDPLYSFTITLERDITIGNYTRAVANHQQPPSPYFSGFLDRVADTVRNEILLSIENSAEAISARDAQRLFRLEGPSQLQTFLDSTRDSARQRGVQWELQGDKVVVSKGSKLDNQIDTNAVIQKLLEYAHNIETNI